MAEFWPNQISVVVPVGPELDELSQGQRSLAVRIPADRTVQALLRQTGPLVTTSANLPGQVPAQNYQSANEYFGDEIDFYVDDGDHGDRPASTIIRVVDDAVEVLRSGAVNIDETGRITNG